MHLILSPGGTARNARSAPGGCWTRTLGSKEQRRSPDCGLWRAIRLACWRQDFDGAIALSLGLTGYVSGSDELSTRGGCRRISEPRLALNSLFGPGMERNDWKALESSLGPSAKVPLIACCALSRGRSAGGIVAGTALNARRSGTSSGSSTSGGSRRRLSTTKKSYSEVKLNDKPEIDTRFKDSLSGDCGKRWRLDSSRHPWITRGRLRLPSFLIW